MFIPKHRRGSIPPFRSKHIRMNNTPQHRKQWILEELKKSPLLSHGEMWGKYGVKWGKGKTTFDKDWKHAQEELKAWQKSINDKVIEETTKTEIEARKKAVLTKVEALAILSDIAKGTAKKVGDQILIPSFKERNGAVSILAKMEGWNADTKLKVSGEINTMPTAIQVEIILPEDED